jgi:Kringle domain
MNDLCILSLLLYMTYDKQAETGRVLIYLLVCTERNFFDEELDPECLQTVDGVSYVGTVNRTLSGKQCQAWSSQSPQIHSYDDLSYFPDKVTSLRDIQNYCRNPGLDEYDVRPWCMPMSDLLLTEYCDIPVCKGNMIIHIVK